MNRINPRKLLLSKWTAVAPKASEKHFLVEDLFCDESGKVVEVKLQAVLTQRAMRIPWTELKHPGTWRMGWQ